MFWHRLALALGSTVEELQVRMSSHEFTHWIAYANVEPFGYPMENWRYGMNTAAVVNAVRSTIPVPHGRPSLKPVQVETFLPVRNRRAELTPKQVAHLQRKRAKRKRSE